MKNVLPPISEDQQYLKGPQSQGEIPATLLSLVEKLRQSPVKKPKTHAQFARMLGLKYTKASLRIHVEHRVQRVLSARTMMDHRFTAMTLDDDVVIFNAPYRRFGEEDVAAVEHLGGFVLADVHEDWGFWHLFCVPMAIMVPAGFAAALD